MNTFWKQHNGKIARFLSIALVMLSVGFVYFNTPNTALALTQNRLPTSDENNSGLFTTAPLWSSVSDANDATFIIGVNNTGGHATFGFTAFSLPASSTISSLAVHYRCRSATTSNANICASILKIGGTYYGSGDTAGGDTGQAPTASTGSVQDNTKTFTTNPKTGAAWTAADINGTGTNPLQAFGVGGNDFNPDVNFYDVDATVNYTNTAPTVALNTPANGAAGQTSTPTLNFTGTDVDGNTVEYNVQVDTVNTFNTQTVTDDSYSETNADNFPSIFGGNNSAVGQTFQSAGGTLKNGKFYMFKSGSPTGTATAKLYAHTGTFGTNGLPTGSVLATSDTFDVSTLTGSPQLKTLTFSGVQQVSLSPGNYVIALEYTGGDASNLIALGYDASAPTHAGNEVQYNNTLSSWSANSAIDTSFYVTVSRSLLNKLSTTATGFSAGHPFTSGSAQTYTVQVGDALANGTYYWRVAATDPTGSNTYGAWSATQSFTVGAIPTVDSNTHVYINASKIILNAPKIILN